MAEPFLLPHASSQVFQEHRRTFGHRLKSNGYDRAMPFIVVCHLVDRALHYIEKLEAKCNSSSSNSLALSVGLMQYFYDLESRTIVEELPACENRQQCKSILIFEPLESIRTAAEKYQVRKRSFRHKGLKNYLSRRRKIGGVPVNELGNQQSPGKSKLLPKSESKPNRRALVSPLYHPSLSLNAPKRDNDSRHRAGRGSPASNCRKSCPVEIAGCGVLKARSQILEFGQLQVPLWTGLHSAMPMQRMEPRHG